MTEPDNGTGGRRNRLTDSQCCRTAWSVFNHHGLETVGSLLLLALCLMPLPAAALGLGKLALHSQLHQPLQAQVTLHLSAGEDASHVQVLLASKQEYSRMGLVWSSELAAINLSRLEQDQAAYRVRLFTTRAVHTPMLTVLLKASKAGRATYFRQYRILLDAPDSRPVVHQQPLVIPVRGYDEPVKHSKATALVSDAASDSAWFRTARYGPVRSGDNLGVIAQRLRKDKRYSNNQVVLALYDENPTVFSGGNINRLKRGAWLVVPKADVVKKKGNRDSMRRLRDLFNADQKMRPVTNATVKRTAAPVDGGEGKRALHFTSNIALHKPTTERVAAHTAVLMDERLAAIHASLNAGKLQMSDLGTSVMELKTSVADIKKDMLSLQKDVAVIKERTLMTVAGNQSDDSQYLWYMLLAGLIGLLSGLITRRRQNPPVSLPETRSTQVVYTPDAADMVVGMESETEADSSADGSDDQTRADDRIGRLIHKAEDRLSRCDYEAAARLLALVPESTTADALKASALRAQLLHETGRAEERDALISRMSETCDGESWLHFCHYLPAQVFNTCLGAGES